MQRSRPAKISLLLADVDGTLVTKDKVLTERAQKAVHAMDAAGIQFAVTSGRPPKGMSMLFEPLTITTPIAGFNGGLFVKPDMTIIESRTLDPDAAHKAAELIEKQGLDVWVYAGDDWLLRDLNAPHREREEHTVSSRPRWCKDFTDEHFRSAVKIVGVSDDLDRVAESREGGAAGARQRRVRRALAALLPGRHQPGRQQGRAWSTTFPARSASTPGRSPPSATCRTTC